MNFTINPLGPTCAAEITGLDCSQVFSPDVWEKIRHAFSEHAILVFRDQKLTTPQMAAFSRQFGKLESYGTPLQSRGKPQVAALRQTGARATPDQMLYISPDDSDVLIMTNEIRPDTAPIAIVDNAEIWHSDGSHKADPYKAIAVYVVQNPQHGGNTEFCDLRALYEALPPDVKAVLTGRNAIHHWSKTRNPRFTGLLDAAAMEEGERIAAMIPEISQPIVRTHPDTGRFSLYLSPRFTLRMEGMPPELSDTLLNSIFDLMDDPAFIYSHTWREGDLMIWDNRCLNHRVMAYPVNDIRRRLRTTVSGDRPFYRPAT